MPVPHLTLVRDEPPIRARTFPDEVAAAERWKRRLAGVGLLLAILFAISECR